MIVIDVHNNNKSEILSPRIFLNQFVNLFNM